MTKNSIIERNIKRKRMFETTKKKRETLKNIRNNKKITLEERFAAQIMLAKLPKNSARSRIQNRCLLTGRARGVYRKFSLSRICIRKLASECKLPGVKKSSWG